MTLNLPPKVTFETLTSSYLKVTPFKRGRIEDYKIEESADVEVPEKSKNLYKIVRISSEQGGKFLVFQYSQSQWRAKAFDVRNEGRRAETRGLFDDPLALFHDAVFPALRDFEESQVRTGLRGFTIRADTNPGFGTDKYTPTRLGICLMVAVRDPGGIPKSRDVTTHTETTVRRTVELPPTANDEVALRIVFEYGKDLAPRKIAPILKCLEDVQKRAGEAKVNRER